MSRLPFLKARFLDPELTRHQIRLRLVRHHLRLRAARNGTELPLPDDEDQDDDEPLPAHIGVDLLPEDYARIDRRATHLHDRILRSSGLMHLTRQDRETLSVLRDGLPLIRIESESRADELAAGLHAEMPWMGPATEHAWQAMRRAVREGQPGFRLPPLILDGPPGIGKTRWARRLGDLLGTASTVVDATGEATSFGVTGCQRGWSNGRPGRVLEFILERRLGNPFVIIDELDKAGTARSDYGQTYGLAEGLLPLLEPATAADWTCPWFRVRFDMSFVSWIMLTNSLSPLPEPLLSRCTTLRLRDLGLPDLIGFARSEGHARALSEASIDSVTEALARVAPRAVQQPSLRPKPEQHERTAHGRR